MKQKFEPTWKKEKLIASKQQKIIKQLDHFLERGQKFKII